MTMKNLKNNLLIASLFSILVLTALVPNVIMKYNISKKMNELHVVDFTLPNTLTDTGEVTEIMTKLKIMSSVNNQDSGVVLEKELIDIPPEISEPIIADIKKQLEILKNSKAIPDLDFQNIQQKYLNRLSKITYLNQELSDTAVNVWDVMIFYEDYDLMLKMDIETSKIYSLQIFVYDKVNINFLNADVIFRYFAEYLGVSNEQIEYSGFSQGKNPIFTLGNKEEGIVYKTVLSEFYFNCSLINDDYMLK